MRKFNLMLLLLVLTIGMQAQQGRFNGEPVAFQDDKLESTFTQYTVFQVDPSSDIKAYLKSSVTDEAVIRLQLGQLYDWNMALTYDNLFSDDFQFRVLTENGPVVTPFDTKITYQGTLVNEPNSEIRMTVTDKWMTGFVRLGNEKIYIEPLSNLIKDAAPGLHVVYDARNVVIDTEGHCDAGGENIRSIKDQEQVVGSNERGADCVEAEIALAGAFDMVGKYGSTGDVANHIIGIMNNTQALYIVHNISYTIVDMVVPASSGADPWSGATCMDNLLPSFRNWGPGGFNGHDVGQLWVNRDVMKQDGDGVCIDGSLIGRASGIGTICTVDRYNCCEDWSSNNAVAQAHLSAHELGHDWDGEHGDAVDNNDIMWPNLTGAATSWSAQNITDIASHRDSRGCLAGADCPCSPDESNPLAWCQDITIQLNGAGSATIAASALDAGSNDACGGVTLLSSRTSFDCSHVPSHFVILTVTDGSGNQSFCGATVTVEDNIDPTAVCKNITVQLNAGGSASVSAEDVDNGSSDNCDFDISLIADAVHFNCGDVGPNVITLTATDDSGNDDDCNSTVTIEDNVPPNAFCKDVTVQIVAGSAAVTAAQVDNGSSDACSLASMSVSPSVFDCDDIGLNAVTLTVTDINDNFSTCGATVTVEGIVPTVFITEAPLPALCQGGTIVLTANATNAVSYLWSTGEVTTSIQIDANGTYEVTVTSVSGCTATDDHIIDDFDLGSLLSAYTILGLEEVHLHGNNTVVTGGVGVVNFGKKAKLHDDSHVLTFTQAPVVDLNGGSTSASTTLAQANVILPPFAGNPYASVNEVKVLEGDVAVLGDCIYHKVELKKNATATFTCDNIFIHELKTKDGATILFSGSANMFINKKVKLEKNNSFNSTGEYVTVYVDDKFEVKEGSDVQAKVYATHDIHAHAKDDNPTSMTGMFIGKKVHGNKPVTWNWDTYCDPVPLPPPPRMIQPEDQDVKLAMEIASIAYPNPFRNLLTIEFNLPENGRTTMEIISINGEVVQSNDLGMLDAYSKHTYQFEPGDFLSAGIYFYRIISGKYLTTGQLILIQ